MKTYSRVVGLMSEVPFKYPRTLRTGLRSANEIKKIGRNVMNQPSSKIV